MKTKLLAMVLLAGGSLYAEGRVSIGVSIGGPAYYGPGYNARSYYLPPPPAPLYTYMAPSPGRGFAWVGGYWSPAGARYQWQPGYWTRPPRGRKHWVGPRYSNDRYYDGYWR